MTAQPQRVVIVGGGQAGVQTAISLRQRGFTGELTIVADEPDLPYQRPPLTKAYLAGELTHSRLAFRPLALYEKLDIRLRLGVPAARLDRGGQRVELEDGSMLGYDRLVLATGARPRPLALEGAELPQLTFLRTSADADRVARSLTPGRRVVIIGGGYIGLEVAAVAVTAGAQVTVLEAAERLLGRVTGTEVAHFFLDAHRRHGVTVLLDARTERFEAGANGAARVVHGHGQAVDADVVVVAAGVIPNTELAWDAGLPCENGIVVDAYGRTGDASVLAAGDCTSHPNGLLRRRLRLESVHNAVEQAKTVAATICGHLEVYAQIPWFWSTQYSYKLQSVGLIAGHDQTVVDDSKDGQLAVYYLRGSEVLAVDAINLPREFARARAVFASATEARLPDLAGFTAHSASAT